jgi:hypothetical protein
MKGGDTRSVILGIRIVKYTKTGSLPAIIIGGGTMRNKSKILWLFFFGITIASMFVPGLAKATLIEYDLILTEGVLAPNPGTQHIGSFTIDDSTLIGGPATIVNPAWNMSIEFGGYLFETSSPPYSVKIDANDIVILVEAQINNTLGTTQLLLWSADPRGPNWWNLAGIGSNQGLYEIKIATVPEPSTMLLLGSGLIGLAGYGRRKFFKK